MKHNKSIRSIYRTKWIQSQSMLSFVDSQCNEIVRKSRSLMNMKDTTKRLLDKVDNKDDHRTMLVNWISIFFSIKESLSLCLSLSFSLYFSLSLFFCLFAPICLPSWLSISSLRLVVCLFADFLILFWFKHLYYMQRVYNSYWNCCFGGIQFDWKFPKNH